MNPKLRNILIGVGLFAVAFAYYYGLSSKEWTWLYVSGDSGDWMQFTNWWITPQPFGSPLFVSLIRLLGELQVADTYHLLNTALSVIPGAVLVVVTYFIGLELTKNYKLGILASLIVMGMSIVLTQATVFEQYMMVAMLAGLAYLAYIKDKFGWAMAFLGLGLANHIIMLPVACAWLLVEWRQWRRILKLSPIYIVTGILPYGLIIWLLNSDVPNLMAGDWSWESLSIYMGSVSVMGDLAISEAPRRILDMGIIVLATLGLAWYPLIRGFWRPWDNKARSTLIVIVIFAWVWFSCLFLTPYKYIMITAPMVAGYAVYGLSKLPHWHRYVVTIGAIILIAVNAVYLDADKLAKLDPQATKFYSALQELPDGSVVLTPRGGSFGFALFYSLSEGKDLVPVSLLPYKDHLEWFHENYGLAGNNSMEITQDALDRGLEVYYISIINPLGWGKMYDVEETDTYGLYRVKSVKSFNLDDIQ